MARSTPDLRRQRLQLAGIGLLLVTVVVALAFRVGDMDHATPGLVGGGGGGDEQATAGDAPTPGLVDLSGPIISEVMVSNGSTLPDEDGDYPDWIELHNPTGSPLDLGGLFLSDDDEDPARWTLPSVELPAEGRIVIFASGKDRIDPAGELHTDFRLSQGDEPILLVDRDGATVLDRIPPADVPRDASVGRDPDDLQRICFFAVARPGEPNAPECFDDVDLGVPSLSMDGGFYDDAIEVTITSPLEDATILYTLDGSFPDIERNPDRTMVYESPLVVEDRSGEPPDISTIDTTASEHPHVADRPGRFGMPDLTDVDLPRATVLRARTPYGAEASAVYLVGPTHRRDALPVVSLTRDPDHLFDHDTGILVAGATYEMWRDSDDHDPDANWRIPTNYNQRGRVWERPAQEALWNSVILDLCEPDDGCVHQQQVGIRTHGGFSRTLPQKSLRVYARNDYGERRIDHPTFGEGHPQGHRRLLLRNSGNDNGQLMYADGFLQSIFRDLRADTQAYRPAVLYINGEYWGIQNLRERYDRHYLEVVHGADPARVEILDNSSPPLVSNRPGGVAAWQELLAELGTYEPTSERFVSELERAVEVDSFFDFIIAHVFVGNRDSISNNARWWREPGGPDALGAGTRDGRWRWLISDFDNSGGGVGRYHASYDVFPDRLPSGAEPSYRDGIPFLFDRTMENEALRNRFLNRFADHLNTTFDSERTVEVLDTTADRLRDEIDLHAVRWRRDMTEKWEGRVAELETFMHERPHIQRQQLVQRFALDGTATLGVQTAGSGTVRVNEIEVASAAPGGAWRGVYFLGVPVTLRAEPLDGYRFVRWEGIDVAATDPEMTLPIRDDVEVEAVFEPVT